MVLFFREEFSVKLDKDFGNYGRESNTTRQTFHALNQCLNMSKLCLIGAKNLNTISSKYGGAVRYNVSTLSSASTRFSKVRIETADEWFAGTDSNVYFGVVFEGGAHEILCDKPLYNDFERNDKDYYPFFLPYRVPLDKITSFYLRTSGFKDEWKFDCAEVYDEYGNIIFKIKDKKKFNRQRRDFSPQRLYNTKADIVPVDHTIMSFLYSLDGVTTEKSWARFPFFKEPNLNKNVFNPLFVKRYTC